VQEYGNMPSVGNRKNVKIIVMPGGNKHWVPPHLFMSRLDAGSPRVQFQKYLS
jgi:hypothetical protein